MGEDIRVNAKIYNMKGFSAHADKQQLLAWYSSMKEVPKAFFVTHGELDAAMELADSLGRNLGTATYIPHFGDCAEIHGTECRCMNPKWFRLSCCYRPACLHAWHGTRLSAATQQNRADCGA